MQNKKKSIRVGTKHFFGCSSLCDCRLSLFVVAGGRWSARIHSFLPRFRLHSFGSTRWPLRCHNLINFASLLSNRSSLMGILGQIASFLLLLPFLLISFDSVFRNITEETSSRSVITISFDLSIINAIFFPHKWMSRPFSPLLRSLCCSAGTNSRIPIKNLTKWHSIIVLRQERHIHGAHTLKQAHETMWSSLGFYLVEKRHFGMDDLHSVLFSFLREMLAVCLCLSFHDFVSSSLFSGVLCKTATNIIFYCHLMPFLVWMSYTLTAELSVEECRWWFDVKSRAVVLTNWPMFRDKLPP